MAPVTIVSREDLVAALKRGPATYDALAVRLGGPDREALVWAVAEAEEAGVLTNSATDCGPDGLCATNAPAVLTLVR
jgi:hypothetical protein